MSKKIVVISTSPHKKSNSEILAMNFMEGAKENGHDVSIIKVRDMNMSFCKGCLSCQKTHKCVIKDDFNKDMLNKLLDADILVFATPVYYYAVSGQLKTFIDRMNPLYSMDYHYKDIYVIATAAEDEKRTFEGITEDIKGFVDCYEGTKIKEKLYVGGLDNGGDVLKNKKALEKAYKMGKSVK